MPMQQVGARPTRFDPMLWPVERQVSVVLEGLRGHRPVTEICREVGITTTRYYQWRDRFLRAGRNGLVQSAVEYHKLEERINQLETEHHHLRVEKEILQGAALED